jgi:hypothetical protein
MKKLKMAMYALEALLTVVSFLIVVHFFPTGGALTKNNSLMDFWVIPVITLLIAAVLEQLSDDKVKIPLWTTILCSRVAAGVGLGLSFGAILILNEWYATPDQGTWEPLFTATGLSSAGVLAAQNRIEKIRKKRNDSQILN